MSRISFKYTEEGTDRMTHHKTSNINPNHLQYSDFDCDYTSYREHKFYLESNCDTKIRFLCESERWTQVVIHNTFTDVTGR